MFRVLNQLLQVIAGRNEAELQTAVNEFCSVCKRRKLKLNAGKKRVMIFERREGEVIDYNINYRMRLPVVVRCRIISGNEAMEDVSEFKYLGTVLCKHGGMEGEIREQVTTGRIVVGSLARVMKGRNVPMDMKRDPRNSIFLAALMYRSENWS